MLFKKISVVGLGYIGLPTAAIFASYNKCVVGVDIDKQKVRAVNKGSVDISEQDLEGISFFIRKVQVADCQNKSRNRRCLYNLCSNAISIQRR